MDESLIDDPPKPRFGRRLSYNSAAMAFGAYPDQTNMCEPTINAAAYFDKCPSVEALIPLAARLLTYERCSGIPVGSDGKNDWKVQLVDAKPVDMIRSVSVKNNDELHQAIEDGMCTSCRKENLPWWEFVRIVNSNGESAVIVRVDHWIGDGLSLVNLMEQVLTCEDGVTKFPSIIPAKMCDKFKRKGGFLRSIGNFFKCIYYFFVVLALPASKYDDNTAFSKHFNKKMTYTWNRKLVKFESMPLSFIKSLKSEANVSLNDVMFACLGGAIRRLNKAQNCDVTEKKGKKKKPIQCRALMPVAFPRPNDDTDDKTKVLRNKWVFISSDFGVGIEDSIERIRYVHGNMNVFKSSPLPVVQLWVQQTIPPKLPVSVAKQTVFDGISRHSCIFSNVPGPQGAVAFGGEVVKEVQMFFNNLVPQVGILSYNGSVFMNMNLDSCIEGGEFIGHYFAQELCEVATALQITVPENIKNKAAELLID
mgnify:CR=1 FL=1